ncbi:MAG: glycerate kinase, partial [Saprospiraceae bacterium]
MKILIAADSFKDALPSFEVCRAIERGIGRVMPRAATVVFPMADGGEGTASVLAHHLGGQQVQCTVSDPLFRPVGTEYFLASNGSVAFIEMAAASGLQLLKTGERNPLETTTFGTGELVLDAMKRGAKKIILGIGGSATNDAGMGMAAALGWSFLSAGGRELSPIGKNLALVHSIVPPPEPGTRTKGARNPKPHNLEVICDVDNPLLGERGAAQVYARQKGADAAAIELLEAGMSHFSKKLANYFGKDFSALPGAGAAGGLGAGAVAFAGATLRPGIDLVMELTEFEKQLDQASLVV